MSAATIVPSPIGDLLLVAEAGALTGLSMDPTDRPPVDSPKDPVLAAAADQLAAYFAGDLKEFDLTLALSGTTFQQRVWTALQDVPFGATVTYGELAARIGHPTASRAVGAANGRNPISIIIPCHRVIGSTGSLIKYGGGLDRKRFLLTHESTFVQSAPRRGA